MKPPSSSHFACLKEVSFPVKGRSVLPSTGNEASIKNSNGNEVFSENSTGTEASLSERWGAGVEYHFQEI